MLIGHQKQWQHLKKIAQLENLSHAYLFYGQEKLGKKTLALNWASYLFNNNAFSRDFKIKEHPDLIFIKPDEKENLSLKTKRKEGIQIFQIRDLIWKLSLKPFSAPFKIALIDDAHLMNQEAQACLLKTLEEPKGKAVLILISHKKQYFFPTILSRLQIIKFNPVNNEEIQKHLSEKNFSKEKIEKICNISSGRPGIFLDFISDEKKLRNFEETIDDFNKILNSPLFFRFQYAKNLSENPDKVKETLNIWLDYLRLALLSRFSPRKNILFSLSEYPTKKLKNIINEIQAVKFLLSSTNVNPKITLEALMMEI